MYLLGFGISLMCAPVMLALKHLNVDITISIVWRVFCAVCLIIGIIDFIRNF